MISFFHLLLITFLVHFFIFIDCKNFSHLIARTESSVVETAVKVINMFKRKGLTGFSLDVFETKVSKVGGRVWCSVQLVHVALEYCALKWKKS